MKFPIDATIKVTYSANVNSSALTGVVGNPNTVQIQYSNNPSKSEQPETETVPGKPNSTTEHPLGEGPTDVTVTYTTELVLTKTDDSDSPKPLAGVQFTLTGTSRQAAVKQEITYDVDPNGTYYLLKTGKYTEAAPRTSSQMVAAEAGATSGYVVDSTYTGADAVVVNNTVYRPYKPTDAGSNVFVLQLENDDDYVSTVVKYKKAEAMTANTGDPVPVTMVGETNEDGTISFAQLAAGTYTLSETKVPAGYNKAEDITFTIDWAAPTVDTEHPLTTATECTWTKNTTNTNNNNDSGITLVTEGEHKGEFTITLVNHKGKELPSTGGIGTTIFYVVGAILVIGAGVILITRRRMDA
jgi:LPXTG-motif cell wall-anchored protein